MTEQNMTCIICPLGCSITVKLEEDSIAGITGNTCPRGAAYAEAEILHPERTLTTTMRCTDGQVVSVKTDRPVPKAALTDCMRQINAARAVLPVSIGDILLRDVWGSNIVATENRQGMF